MLANTMRGITHGANATRNDHAFELLPESRCPTVEDHGSSATRCLPFDKRSPLQALNFHLELLDNVW